jgi:dTDP-4-dehydrorhamnose reductase
MLGRAVCAKAARRGHEVHARSRGELDVVDAGAVRESVEGLRPGAIVNCAAWTDVDGAEAHSDAAHAINATGAGNVARAAGQAGARLVHVSTDYVFDGRGSRPYVESDPTGPGCAYGRSKLAGEREVAAASPTHTIVRTSWLFGAGGRNFVDTMLALGGERDRVAVVTDQVGCPTWTGHLSGALLELAEKGPGGIVHVAGSGSCSWNEFARQIFALAGLDCRVESSTTEAMGRPAPRPAFSVLSSARDDAPRLPPWQEGLRAYLAERGALAAPAISPEAPANSPEAPAISGDRP